MSPGEPRRRWTHADEVKEQGAVAAAYESEPATHCLAASSRSASGRMMPMSVSQMGMGRGGAARVRLRGARVWGAAERGADLSRSGLLWLRGGGGGGAGRWAAMLGGGWAARTLALELREDLEGARARMLLDDGVAAVGAADEAEHVHQACGGGPGVPVRGRGQVRDVPGRRGSRWRWGGGAVRAVVAGVGVGVGAAVGVGVALAVSRSVCVCVPAKGGRGRQVGGKASEAGERERREARGGAADRWP